MSDLQVKPKEIRQARSFLQSRGLTTSDISPKLFAITAKKVNKTFVELLAIVARLKMAGQGLGQSAQTEEALS